MTDPLPTPAPFSPDISIGDGGILFKTDRGKALLLPGNAPAVGDVIAIHPTKEKEWVTHGQSIIHVDDEVLVVPLEGGDKVALRPGQIYPMANCPNNSYSCDDDSPEALGDGSYLYKEYNFRLDHPIYRRDLNANLRMDFHSEYWWHNDLTWYPWGAVWLGFSETGVQGEIYWAAADDPFMVIRGGGIAHLGESGTGQDTLCYVNCLNNTSIPTLLPEDLPVNYIHVHVSGTASLFFQYNGTKSKLVYLTLCSGTVRNNFCESGFY
jgi:hypothetical protein